MSTRRNWRLIALLPLLATIRCSQPTSPQDPIAVAQVEEILAGGRWIKPRITGIVVSDACTQSGTRNPARVLTAADCLAPSSHQEPRHIPLNRVSVDTERIDTIQRRHGRAVLLLVMSRSKGENDRAIEMLEQYSREEPDDARVSNDLAAAYYVRAHRFDQPIDLARALEKVEQALRVSPSMPEARFNQGLIFEALAYAEAAEEAWRTYRQLDSSSGWSEEVVRWLTELQGRQAGETWLDSKGRLLNAIDDETIHRIVRRFPSAARQLVHNELLPEWAALRREGRTERARNRLRLAKAVATELVVKTGDALLLRSIFSIETSQSNPSMMGDLIQGHLAFRRAEFDYADSQFEKAETRYSEAEQALTQAGSPFRHWAKLNGAISLLLAHQSEKAMEQLSEIREEEKRYPILLARISWIEALCFLARSRPYEAYRAYLKSLEGFQEANEEEQALNIHVRLGEVLDKLGRRDSGWRHRLQALQGQASLWDVRRRSALNGTVASAFLEMGLVRPALTFQEEALTLARETDNATYLALALQHYANVALRVEQPALAKKSLDEALKHTEKLPEEARLILRARIKEVEGELHTGTPRIAVESFSQAIDLLLEAKYRGYLAELHFKRGQAHQNDGRIDLAEFDFKRGLNEVYDEWEKALKRRKRGEGEEVWAPYLDSHARIFDALIRLLVAQKRTEAALEIAEASRAADLLDLVSELPGSDGILGDSEDGSRGLSAAKIMANLPENVKVLQYRMLEDESLVWVIGRSGLEMERIRHPSDRIEGQVRVIHQYAQRGEPQESDVRAILQELYTVLISPIRSHLESDDRIVVIPDRSLHRIPFSALRDPNSGRYLVQDFEIRVAPSSTFYLFTRERNQKVRRSKEPTALLIANPDFDREPFPGLDPLLNAYAEVDGIKAFYQGPNLFRDANATETVFLEGLRIHQVVHFAGHSIGDPARPFESVLLLAPDLARGTTGRLYAHEIVKEKLGRTVLVALSACQTAGGASVGAVGSSGLVRPFLGAGVPGVLASIWDVRDGAAEPLLIEFHRRFSQGEEAAAALRHAQCYLLEGNLARRSVRSWAAFQIVGEASLWMSQTEEEK